LDLARTKAPKDQSEKFKEAARALKCDDNEEAVDELMKRRFITAPTQSRKG
jgi:hypothetical protein